MYHVQDVPCKTVCGAQSIAMKARMHQKLASAPSLQLERKGRDHKRRDVTVSFWDEQPSDKVLTSERCNIVPCRARKKEEVFHTV